MAAGGSEVLSGRVFFRKKCNDRYYLIDIGSGVSYNDDVASAKQTFERQSFIRGNARNGTSHQGDRPQKVSLNSPESPFFLCARLFGVYLFLGPEKLFYPCPIRICILFRGGDISILGVVLSRLILTREPGSGIITHNTTGVRCYSEIISKCLTAVKLQ